MMIYYFILILKHNKNKKERYIGAAEKVYISTLKERHLKLFKEKLIKF